MREEPKPVHTLCHGDFWSNNILFTYGEDPDNPSSLIIIDYQLIFVGSPCYGKFLTAILHRGLRNDFFFFSQFTFFQFLFGLLFSFSPFFQFLFQFCFNSFSFLFSLLFLFDHGHIWISSKFFIWYIAHGHKITTLAFNHKINVFWKATKTIYI